MAITYTATAANTAGTEDGSVLRYKDVTVSAQSGDLIVAFGVSENGSTGTGSCATLSGSTTSWTNVRSAGAQNADCGFEMAWAEATATGTVTVRVTVPGVGANIRVMVAAWVVPAADWDSVAGTTNLGGGDTDGAVSVVLSDTSTVLYAAGDWSAADPGSGITPAGGTIHTSYFDTTNYSVSSKSWTSQASGTRNYGPTGLSGRDFIGAVLAITEPSGSGVTGTAATTLPAVTAAGSGTVTAPTFSGTAATTLPAVTAAGSGTVTAPTFSGTAATTLPLVTAAGSGTVTAPTFSGTAATTLPLVTAAGSGTVTLPSGTGAAAITLPVVVAAGSGTVTVPPVTGTAATTLPVMTASATGTAVAAITGTAAVVLPVMVASAASVAVLWSVWDGQTEQPAVTVAVWDGTSEQPAQGYEVTS